MGPHQGRVEGEENLPRPAGHTPLNASQDPIGLLGSQGMLLAFVGVGTCLCGLVPAGAVSEEAVDEVGGRSGRLHREH